MICLMNELSFERGDLICKFGQERSERGISNLDVHILGQGLNGQVVEWVDVDEDWMATNPQITRFLEFFATTPPQLCEADEIDRIN